MKSKYRIKQAALPFFDPKYATKINSKEYWINEHVSEFAIEQVEDCYVSYGISKSENMTSLSGFHYSEQSCYFDFTLHFNGIDYRVILTENNNYQDLLIYPAAKTTMAARIIKNKSKIEIKKLNENKMENNKENEIEFIILSMSDDSKFALTYLPEKVQLLHYMRKGDINLYIQACAEVYEGLRSVGLLENYKFSV